MVNQHIKEEWVPFLIRIVSSLEEDNLFDRERVAILLIAASYYINKCFIKKKDASQILGWAINSYFANTPLEFFKNGNK